MKIDSSWRMHAGANCGPVSGQQDRGAAFTLHGRYWRSSRQENSFAGKYIGPDVTLHTTLSEWVEELTHSAYTFENTLPLKRAMDSGDPGQSMKRQVAIRVIGRNGGKMLAYQNVQPAAWRSSRGRKFPIKWKDPDGD